MPDINEGLEIGGQPVVSYEEGDVNTQSGFEAGIARAVAGEDAPPETEEETPAPETEEDTEEAPEEEPEGSADIWRTRYEEQQKVMGRMSTELGDARAQLAEMQTPMEYMPSPSMPVNVEAMIDQIGGSDAVEWAIDNAPDQIETIARAWAMTGDPEGAVFYADYRAEKAALDNAPQEVAPQQDPTLTEMATQQKLVQVFKEQRTNDPEFASYEPGIATALSSESVPDEIKLMLMSGNIDHMRAGMNFLKPYAQIEAFRAGTPTAPKGEPAVDTPQEQARRDSARRTAIVTGSQRLQSAGEQPDTGELTSEERIRRFKEAFEAEPSTSIAAGLTINGQPVLPSRPRSTG